MIPGMMDMANQGLAKIFQQFKRELKTEGM